MKILITGANGQLGKDLMEALSKQNEVIGVDRGELDITSLEDVIKNVASIRPDVIINSAAFTNVDGCESEADSAYAVNGIGAGNLAIASEKYGCKLVQISTDFIFDGSKTTPLLEYDRPNPLSVYGASKLMGEEMIRDHCSRFFIIRTAWLYGHKGHNFVKTMLKLAETRDTLTVVNDQIGSPTYTKDLVEAINMLICTEEYGVYHCSNDGECSWNEFAKKIFELSGKEVNVLPVSSEEYGAPATRPAYSVMRNQMLELRFNHKIRHWEDALKDYLSGE